MRTITLSNGKEFAADWCGAAGDTLNINVVGDYNSDELTAVFSDPDNTRRITFVYGEMQQAHDGYTDLRAVTPSGWSSNATLITLRKE